MPERTGEELFGPGNTWWDVRQHALRDLNLHCPGFPQELREDAAMQGLLTVMVDWVRWKGSIVEDDPELTFKGAKRVCALSARTWLRDETTHPTVMLTDAAPPEQDPLIRRASAAIEELQHDTRDWQAWAKDLLEGLTERESATKHRVTQQAINKRRKRGLRKAQPIFRKHGLVRKGAK